MGLIRVSDFAKEVGCTPQNIYKHIRNYAQELEGHTQGSRRGLLLDDEAQRFIRNVMYPKELSAEASGVMEELNALRGEFLRLGAKHAELAAKLAQTEGERDRALLDVAQVQKALTASKEAEEAKAAELEQANQDYEQAKEALEGMREEAHMRLQEAQAAEQREQEALQQAQAEREAREALEARMAALKGRSWWERLTRKGED